MAHPSNVRKTYKYRLYRCDKRDQHLHRQISIAGTVWNHALALQKRYYRLTGKYIALGVLKTHIANLRMRTRRYAFWKQLGSQTVQDVLERLDNGYQRFFKRLAHRPPKYKKVRQRKSFTLPLSRLGPNCWMVIKSRSTDAPINS
jgi:putative transposase